MNKLKESKQSLDDAEILINMLNIEVYRLRNIVARYHKKFGENVTDGFVQIDNDMQIVLSNLTKVKIVNSKDYELKSNFQQIQELNKRLGYDT